MKLYHTSVLEVRNPNISFSRDFLDFGKGFYLTVRRLQAESYGKRFLLQKKPAVMNVFELDDNRPGFSHKVFDAYDEAWLDYVACCRRGLPCERFDVIEGGIANDKVFNTVDLYFSGIYTKEQALDQLRFLVPNHQLCITSQTLIDRHLHFIESIKL